MGGLIYFKIFLKVNYTNGHYGINYFSNTRNFLGKLSNKGSENIILVLERAI